MHKNSSFKIRCFLFICMLVNALPAFANEEIGLPPIVNKLLTPDRTIKLNVPLRNDLLHIVAGKDFGGAIVSLTFRGKQYVNNDNGIYVDYGRQIQSAVSYDEMGECFNPTEAGGRYDLGKEHSSSAVISANNSKDSIEIVTDMAFWMQPNEKHQLPGCGGRWVGNYAKNASIREGYVLRKRVTVGLESIDNVIKYDVQFFTPIQRDSGVFEPVSLHFPKEFTDIYISEPDGKLIKQESSALRVKKPIIVSTADNQHAIGLIAEISEDVSQYWYGVKKWPTNTTLRDVFVKEKLSSKTDHFISYVVIGTLDEVNHSINKLAYKNNLNRCCMQYEDKN